MALPNDIQMVEGRFGSAVSMFGDAVTMTVTVKPTHDLIWVATGQPVLAFAKSFTISAGLEGTIRVPAVNQPGWRLSSSTSGFTMWAYELDISFVGPGGTAQRKLSWQPLVGQTVVDLDLIPSGQSVPPVAGAYAVVTSVGGYTGAVTVDQLRALGLGSGSGGSTPATWDTITGKPAFIASGATAAAARTALDVQSTAQVTSAITTAINNLVNGAPAALDTLKEISDALAADDTAIDGVVAALANRATIAYVDQKVAAIPAPTPPTTDASALTTGVLPLARLGSKTIGLAQLANEVTDQLGAVGSPSVPYRPMSVSGPLVLTDADSGIEAGHPTTAIDVRIPTSSQVPFSVVNPPTIEIVRTDAAEVTVVPTVGTMAAQGLQNFLIDTGSKVRAKGASIFARLRTVPTPARPTAGLRALLVADTMNAAFADNAFVTYWTETSGSSLALPVVAQGDSAKQPRLRKNAMNGHSAVWFDGGDLFALTGSWLDLFRNRTSALVCVAFTATTVTTGERVVLSWSIGTGDGASSRLILKQRDASGNVAFGGRRLDADSTNIYVTDGASRYPELTTMVGRYEWSSSDLTVLRDGVQANQNTSFQTDGSSSDTPSINAMIGMSGLPTAPVNGLIGGIAEIAVYDYTAATEAAWNAFASATYGEKWHISGGVA